MASVPTLLEIRSHSLTLGEAARRYRSAASAESLLGRFDGRRPERYVGLMGAKSGRTTVNPAENSDRHSLLLEDRRRVGRIARGLLGGFDVCALASDGQRALPVGHAESS